ncbi:hypothetical protein KBA41_04840 [Candidatus Ozemobacteraceae bacterium]|nr:hypothetical protein [Candidatus Ozemobacteraceae bacterium]
MSRYSDRIDLSDIRWFLIGCVLLLVPLVYILITIEKSTEEESFSSHTLESRASAFDILQTRPSGAGGSSPAGGGGVMAQIESGQSPVEHELDKAWKAIQSAPRTHSYPQDMTPEGIMMSEVADNPDMVDANANLDHGDLKAAEVSYKNALSQARDNAFLEVEAYGGLMEVYKRTGNISEFVKAFKNYALAAQKLKHVYGPVADNIARASEMFAQLAKVDPGRLREELVKGNLAMGTNVDVTAFMKAIEDARKLHPADLPDSESIYPKNPGG